MRKLVLLFAGAILLTGCAANPFQGVYRAQPLPQLICPSWVDQTKSQKAKLADEIEKAPLADVWPEVVISDQSIKDQLIAGGCLPT